MVATWRGHSPTVGELVRAGAQIDAQDQVYIQLCVCVCEWWQPVYVYVYDDCVCVVQEGFSSLILAIRNKHVEVAESLINAKANLNITDNVSNEWEMVSLCVYWFASL